MFGLGKRRAQVEVTHTEVPHEQTAAERSLEIQLARIAAAQQVIADHLAEQMAMPDRVKNRDLVLALLDVQAALVPPPVVPGRS